ncbi:hypothetical protein DOS77_03720, partial [Staphylococcus felis]|uniref:hypothetical protein n=1 Tax=Staphylococcus felis TaxID=46127 RepID=UPI000E3A2EF7
MKATVTRNQAQENTPGYEDGSTTPGNPVTGPQTGDCLFYTSDAADEDRGGVLGGRRNLATHNRKKQLWYTAFLTT